MYRMSKKEGMFRSCLALISSASMILQAVLAGLASNWG